MIIGRWGSESSARLYIQRADILLLRGQVTLAPRTQRRVALLASLGPDVFSLVSRLSKPGG